MRHLKLLELVDTSGSLTAAAEALHISQPSATKMLQELESAFGCSLVDRTTRGGTLSIAGVRALERLRIATGALDAISMALVTQSETPLVRIGMLPLAGVSLIPRLVAELSPRGVLPRLQLLTGTVSEVLALLRQGRIDCVIGRVDTDSPERNVDEFDIVSLSDERFEVACGYRNPLAKARKLKLAELRDSPWIIPPKQTYTRQIFDAAFVSIGLTPPHAHIESRSFHTSLATVAKTSFLTIAPRSAVNYYTGMGKVYKLNLVQPFQSDYAVFITLKNTTKLAAIQLIQSTFQRLAA